MTLAFGILALQTKSTLAAECPGGGCPPSDSSTVSNLSLYGTLADVGLGISVAGVVTGIVLYVTEKPSSSTASLHVEPWIGLGSGGLRGSF
jgi:hypothetical protein